MEESSSQVNGISISENEKESSSDLDFRLADLSNLADSCRKETDAFFRTAKLDESTCMELFRLALQEADEEAWGILVVQYGSLIRSWIMRHPSFAQADEDLEYFFNQTLDNFWRAFKRDPGKLAKFKGLSAVLQYLKLCTFTAVQEYVERQMGPQQISLSDRPIERMAVNHDPIEDLDDRMQANKVWGYVIACAKSDQERTVAQDYFIYGMKPREIYARHREMFSGVIPVSRVKGNFIARLRRDRRLHSLIAEHNSG